MMTLLDDNFDVEKSNNYDKTNHQISLLCTVHCTRILCYHYYDDDNVNAMMIFMTTRYLLCTWIYVMMMMMMTMSMMMIMKMIMTMTMVVMMIDDDDYDGQVPFVHGHK